VTPSEYVVGLSDAAGEGVVALGLAELLSHRVAVGVFQPVLPPAGRDRLLRLLTSRYPAPRGYDAAYGVTAQQAAALAAGGGGEELIGQIVDRERALRRQCDAMVVLGGNVADDGDSGAATVAFHARLATEFGCVVVPVVNGLGCAAAALSAAASTACPPVAGRTTAPRAPGAAGAVTARSRPRQRDLERPGLRGPGEHVVRVHDLVEPEPVSDHVAEVELTGHEHVQQPRR
jgi:phosphate acetyltransferase